MEIDGRILIDAAAQRIMTPMSGLNRTMVIGGGDPIISIAMIIAAAAVIIDVEVNSLILFCCLDNILVYFLQICPTIHIILSIKSMKVRTNSIRKFTMNAGPILILLEEEDIIICRLIPLTDRYINTHHHRHQLPPTTINLTNHICDQATGHRRRL